ncbi:LysR family transcriptional regulator [Allofranklinella schreckenbergeri]|uniref:LysR family transcriptional regulator n=1 Tax=Allofranklinella schreckenbergeri TaxID=1076744 RepID=A0A3M6QBT8_9BURK|nr:LysR family transcriptional regulator [Allofranklinella schreckenbergeri]RMX00081.1 LysR family transcriptional regulator [Allofranklinella schreckenbergeri]
MNRLSDIALFLQVLDSGSISAAARHMDISPAVASQRLQRLESELGLRLLHRTTRRLHPTPEGLALAQEGRPLVAELEALASRLQQHSQRISGALRLTAPPSFGSHYLNPLLPGFLAAHPQLHICLHLDDRPIDLAGDGFDLAIRIGALSDSSLIARRLADNHRALVAAPGYLKTRGAPQRIADLAEHDCLLHHSHPRPHYYWRLINPEGEEESVRVHGRLASNYGDALRQAAIAGLGIAIHSLWHIHQDLRAGRLERVLPDCRLPDSGIYAVMPTRSHTPPRVRAFVDYLAEALAGLDWHPP